VPIILRSDSSGFTLIEVMMAILIMSVGLLGLLQSVMVAYEHNARNRLREEALLIGEEQMGALINRCNCKSKGFDTVSTIHIETLQRPIAGANRDFIVTKQTQPLGSDPYNITIKKLTVAVAWSFKNVSATHMIYTMKTR
jgi:type IV pilus assembly protein PilV